MMHTDSFCCGHKGPSGFALGMTGCVADKAYVIPSVARDLCSSAAK